MRFLIKCSKHIHGVVLLGYGVSWNFYANATNVFINAVIMYDIYAEKNLYVWEDRMLLSVNA